MTDPAQSEYAKAKAEFDRRQDNRRPASEAGLDDDLTDENGCCTRCNDGWCCTHEAYHYDRPEDDDS
jgi:hypothetical protein